MGVYKLVEAGRDVEEVTEKEVLEEIKKYAVNTGGFRITVEKEVPKYIVLIRSSRPGPSFDSRALDTLITDGNLEFISEKHIYNYPTTNAHMYKYKISNASFVLVVQWEGNDFQGGWQEWTRVIVYGDCPFIQKLQELQEELAI
jgi:mRNA-degrading endonuclease RelE of RelBE toxin-antitoxin system